MIRIEYVNNYKDKDDDYRYIDLSLIKYDLGNYLHTVLGFSLLGLGFLLIFEKRLENENK